VPISYHFLRLYSATGRACRRKWRYIKYTPLPLPLSSAAATTIYNLAFNQLTKFGKHRVKRPFLDF